MATVAQSQPRQDFKTIWDLPLKFQEHQDYKIKDTTFERVSLCEGSFFEYLEFLKAKPNVAKINGGNNSASFNNKVYESRTGAKGGGDNSWVGGRFEDVLKPHSDFDDYHQALKKIQGDKLWREVVTAMGETMQRRRVRSEYDGDFDYDKRWDVEPYQERSKKPLSTRIVKLTVESSFSASVKSQTINAFAGFVGAVITLLEQSGILVELKVNDTGTNFLDNGKNCAFCISLNVKKADEYLPPAQVMKALSSVWYRRAIFGLICANAQNLRSEVSDGLGSPFRFGVPWERKDNELFIYSVPDFGAQHKIVESLTELLGVKPKGK